MDRIPSETDACLRCNTNLVQGEDTLWNLMGVWVGGVTGQKQCKVSEFKSQLGRKWRTRQAEHKDNVLSCSNTIMHYSFSEGVSCGMTLKPVHSSLWYHPPWVINKWKIVLPLLGPETDWLTPTNLQLLWRNVYFLSECLLESTWQLVTVGAVGVTFPKLMDALALTFTAPASNLQQVLTFFIPIDCIKLF